MARVGSEVLASGLGCALTDTIFNPLEMLKVRIQLQPSGSRETLRQAATTVWRLGGLWLLWTPGLQATWARAFGVTGLRVGLYPTMRSLVGGGGERGTGVMGKAAAGMATGALSAALANPIDMCRTRVHAQVGGPQRYTSALHVARSVIQSEGGIRALWRGISATVARQALISGGQLSSYDTAKSCARERWGVREGVPLHVCCGLFSGFVAQLVCMPADVLKVKILSGDHGSSALACLRATLSTEGVFGLFRGFTPAVTRQCPVILVQMPLIEYIRDLAGLGHI